MHLWMSFTDSVEKLPAQLQLYFNVMFSNKCLHEPEKRPTAQMLLTILQRFC